MFRKIIQKIIIAFALIGFAIMMLYGFQIFGSDNLKPKIEVTIK